MTDRCLSLESCPSWSKEHDWKSCNESTLIRGFESLALRHVGASYVSLAPTFFKSHSALTPLLLLFRKKSRSAHLFGCKRPHDGSLSLPIFCELRGFKSTRRNTQNIFFMCLSHKLCVDKPLIIKDLSTFLCCLT